MANFEEDLTVTGKLDERTFIDKQSDKFIDLMPIDPGTLFGTTRLGVSAALGNLKDPPPNAAAKFDEIEQQVADVRETILNRRSRGPEVVNARSPLDRIPIVTDIDYETADAETEVFPEEEPFDWKADALLDGSAWKSTGEAYKAFRIKETGDPEGAVLDPYEGLLIAELYQPEALNIIRQHEAYRTGKTISDGYSEEAIVKDFLIFQRYLEDLNLQTTAYHMKRTMTGSDRQANSFAKGQLLFEYLGSAFQSQNSSQEKRDAIANHFWGTMSSAENVFTLGSSIAVKNAGIKTLAKKLAAPRVLRTYRTLFKQAKLKYNSALSLVENVSKAEIPDAAKKSLIESAEKAKRILERNIFKNVTNSQVINKTKSFWNKTGSTLPNAVRSIENKAIWSAAAIDGVGAMFTDWLGQKTRQFHDPNREYVPLQTAAMSLVGIAGGSIALATNLFGKASNKIKHRKGPKVTDLQDTKRQLGNYLFNEYLEHVARIEGRAAKQNVSEVVDPSNATKWAGADATIKLNKIKFTSFYDKAKKGAPLRWTREGLPLDLEETINFTWLFGDQNAEIKGVVDILQDYGIKYEGKRIGLKSASGEPIEDNFANWFLDVLQAVPAPVRKQIEETYEATLKKSTPQYADKTLPEAYTMLAAEIRSSGKILGQQGYLAKVLGNATNPEAIAKQLKEFGGSFADSGFARGMSDVNYLQSTIIKSMITHPGTTGINLYGWRLGTTLQTTADISRLVIHGGKDIIQHVSGLDKRWYNYKSDGPNPFWHEKTRSLAEGITAKSRAIIDPYTTMNEFEDILRTFPTDTKPLSQYIFGGVSEMSEMQKLNDKGIIFTPKVRAVFDKGMDKMQSLFMVRLFDTYSKSIELKKMMVQKTKEIYGVDYADFIKSEKFATEVISGRWSVNVMTPAVDVASRMTYSKSFGKSFTGAAERGVSQPIVETVGQLAKLIEGARKFPYFGAQIPFGQFFNNHISNLMDYTGVSLAHHLFLRTTGRKDLITRDIDDVAAKGAVGMTIIATMAVDQVRRLDRGLPWYTDEDATGQPGNIVYQFPRSLFDGPARMIAHAYKGEVGKSDTTWQEVKEMYKMYFSNPDNVDKWENGNIPPALVADIVSTMGTTGLTRQLQGNLSGFVRSMRDAVIEDDPEFIQQFHYSWGKVGSDMFGIPLRMFEPFDEAGELFFGEGEDFLVKDKKSGNEYYKKLFSYVDFSSNKLLEVLDAPDSLQPKEKYSGFSEEPTVRNMSGVNRPEGVPTYIIKMMVQIGVPPYKINRKGLFPEADNRINSLVPHLVNMLAQNTLQEPRWIDGDVETRTIMYRGVVSLARKKAKELLLKDTVGTGDEDGRLGRLITVDQLVGSNKGRLKKALNKYKFMDDDGEVIKDAFELNSADLEELIEALKIDAADRGNLTPTMKDIITN